MGKNTLFVGLDVHKESISVATAAADGDGEVTYVGRIPNSPEALTKLVKKLGRPERLRFCYEAGACGYVVYWKLVQLGASCDVIAPSLIPSAPGDRVKTDRLDAERLATLHRSGMLTAVWVPDAQHQALRELVRARESGVEDMQRNRRRMNGFLLQRGRHRPKGWTAWTQKHMTWISQQTFEQAADEVVLREMVAEIEHQKARIARLDAAIDEALAAAPAETRAVVQALTSLRGIKTLTAVTIVSELGSVRRFKSASALMAYAGVVPREFSSGGPGKAWRGGITKTGNSHVRRVLIESAWHYTKRPGLGLALRKRQQAIEAPYQAELVEISLRAQHRLTGRYKRLMAREKPAGKAVTAVARELLGFIWHIGTMVERHLEQHPEAAESMRAAA